MVSMGWLRVYLYDSISVCFDILQNASGVINDTWDLFLVIIKRTATFYIYLLQYTPFMTIYALGYLNGLQLVTF